MNPTNYATIPDEFDKATEKEGMFQTHVVKKLFSFFRK